MSRVIASQRLLVLVLLLMMMFFLLLCVAVLDSTPAHPRAMLADAGYTIHAAHNVVRELCHKEHIAVRHDGDGPVAHCRIILAD